MYRCFLDLICPLCGHECVNKYGRTKAGTQRYKCRKLDCGKVFVEEQQVYTKTEKRLLSMLVEFLEFDQNSVEKYDVKDFFNRIKEKHNHESARIIIEQSCNTHEFNINSAKVLICKEGNKISVFKVDVHILREIEAHKKAIFLSPSVCMLTKEEKKLERDAKKAEAEKKAKEVKMEKKIQRVRRKQLAYNRKEDVKILDKVENIEKYKQPQNNKASEDTKFP